MNSTKIETLAHKLGIGAIRDNESNVTLHMDTIAGRPVVIYLEAVKVVGSGFTNADGSSRQDTIANLGPGDIFHLVREPENPYDAGAVAVHTATGAQIGYLPSKLANTVTPYLLDGWEPFGKMAGITERKSGIKDVSVYLFEFVPEAETGE